LAEGFLRSKKCGMKAVERIGFFGGSFDPVHCAHLRMAKQIIERFALGRIVFIPAARPPHKPSRRLAPAAHRLAMLRLATDSHRCFEVSTEELDRGGTSYTVDTVKALISRNPAADWFSIIGSDSLRELPDWHRAEELIRMVRFVTVMRPGFPCDVDSLPAGFAPTVREALLRDCIMEPAGAISSSEIRARLEQGLSVDGLVPEAVLAYIREHRLYGKG